MHIQNERGIALVTVLLVTLVVLTLMGTAAVLGGNSALVTKYRQRETLLMTVADAGIEGARSAVNGTRTLMPDTGYKGFETRAIVYDAAGNPIPNVTRTTYIGPTGITSGQYGVFASVVTVAKDIFGNTVVRRGEIDQESFAKYAYFTNTEGRSEEHTSELQSRGHLVCRLLLEKKKNKQNNTEQANIKTALR